MSTIEIKDTDLVLKPISGLRGKRPHGLPKGELKAFVWLDDGYSGTEYAHPMLSLRITHDQGYGPIDTELLSIKFQRNRIDRPDTIRTPARGFMKGPTRSQWSNGKWSICYAGQVTARLYDTRLLQVGLDLIERAKETIKYRNNEKVSRILSRDSCELLNLIAGLQRVGVKIVIRDGRIKRSAEYSLVA